jgi:Leucine-rich repeat (LRR) protein
LELRKVGWLVFCLFYLCIQNSNAQTDLAREKQVLEEFYHSLNGEDWIRRDNWLSAVSICDWHGIKCDENGHPIEIQLYDNGLEGPLPESICKLSELRTLYLSFNKINGRLPSFHDCHKLENIWLKANQLEGGIPQTLCDGGNLVEVDLHVNDLSGPLPETISGCRRLSILRMEANQLTGPIPSALYSLRTLKELYLQKNKIDGTISSDIGNLDNLKYLFLDHNKLTGALPSSLSKLKKLITLRLECNHLEIGVPPNLPTAQVRLEPQLPTCRR